MLHAKEVSCGEHILIKLARLRRALYEQIQCDRMLPSGIGFTFVPNILVK